MTPKLKSTEAPRVVVDNSNPQPEMAMDYTQMSAMDIAAMYSAEMADIVVSCGETITEDMFDDADVSFAADAASDHAGELLRNRAGMWMRNHATEIGETLARAAESSVSPRAAAEELRKLYVEHAETLARTEMARAREEANLGIMRAQGVARVQFIAAVDERLCPICGAYHGRVFSMLMAPVLPLHPNCRCTLVPYVGDVRRDIMSN